MLKFLLNQKLSETVRYWSTTQRRLHLRKEYDVGGEYRITLVESEATHSEIEEHFGELEFW